jgi:hypothetical protein
MKEINFGQNTGCGYFCSPKTERVRDDLVAQLVEQYTFNVWALGSSPSGITGSFII